MTYSRAATDYIAGPCSVGPVRAWTASDVAAAFDAGAASVTVRAEPITTYRQPERVLTTSEFLRTAEDALVRDKHGNIRSIRSARVTDDGPYVLVYDPTAPASPPVPEPVLLTSEDPRWRDGAKVRGVFADGTAVEGWVDDSGQGRLCVPRAYIPDVASHTWWRTRFAAVSLLAEAPDPDADVVVRLVEVGLEDGDRARDLLTDLRAAGYDVVKRAEP